MLNNFSVTEINSDTYSYEKKDLIWHCHEKLQWVEDVIQNAMALIWRCRRDSRAAEL